MRENIAFVFMMENGGLGEWHTVDERVSVWFVPQGTVSTVRSGQIVTSGGQQVIKIPASQVQQLTAQQQNVQVLSNKVWFAVFIDNSFN